MTYFLFFVSLGGMVAAVYKDSVPLAIVTAAVFVAIVSATGNRLYVLSTQPNNNKENTNE
jgi:hypothetical protein